MSSKDFIQVKCKACSNVLRFGADKAGKRAKCKCGAVVTIAEEEKQAPPPPPDPPAEEAPNPLAHQQPTAESIGDYGVGGAIETLTPIVEQGERKKDKTKKPKVRRKVKPLENQEEWEKVRLGLLIMFVGACIWGFAHLLHGSYVLIGSADFPEYSSVITREQMVKPAPNRPDEFWGIDPYTVLLGIISGSGYLGYAKICMICVALLTFLQYVTFGAGYGFCLPIPDRFGTKLQVYLLLGLLGANLLFYVIFQLLPILGVFQYYMVPLLFPEVGMSDTNIERTLPLSVLWSGAPFFETFTCILLQFMMYLEPTVGSILLWSIGLSIKEPRIEKAATMLTYLCLGQFFVLLCYQMISVAGSTAVLVLVLRVLYIVWYGFLTMFILQYSSLLLKTRELIEAKLNPAHEATD